MGGDGRLLLPHWCESVEDIPADLMRAIQHAHRVLSWFENYPEDELPEEWMWPFDELIVDHFDRIHEARGVNVGGQDDDVEAEQNSLTAGLRERMKKV